MCLTALLLLILFSGCINNINKTQNAELTGVVCYVVDGDTVDVTVSNGSKYRIRLLGVDTPEKRNTNKPNEYILLDGTPITNTNYLKIWGIKATNFAKNKLENKTVKVVFDGSVMEKGRYGRYLAYIYVNGTNFNEELIKYGYARVYISDFTLKDKFLEEEKYAKKNKIGLWNWSNN